MRAMNKLTKLKTTTFQVFWSRLASFGQLGLISDSHVDKEKSRNGMDAHKGSENINYRNNPKYLDILARSNSLDPDQTPQNAASDQGRHCLPFVQQYFHYENKPIQIY